MGSFSSTLLTRPATLAEFWRYVFVGLATNIGGYGLYLLVTYVGASPKAAVTVLYSTGTLLGFLSHRAFTFGDTGNAFQSAALYLAAYGLGYLLNISILALFVDRLGYPHELVQALAIPVVAVFLFLALKLVVFRRPRSR